MIPKNLSLEALLAFSAGECEARRAEWMRAARGEADHRLRASCVRHARRNCRAVVKYLRALRGVNQVLA